MRRPRRARKRGRRKNGTYKSYDHRTHPRKVKRPGPGACTWCLQPILSADGTPNRRRTWCGPECVSAYLLRTDSKLMRRHVFLRDDGVCATCGKVWRYLSDAWQADHIKPLYQAFGDESFWEPDNVRVLCTDPCHKAKSAADLALYGRSKATKSPPKRTRLAQRLA